MTTGEIIPDAVTIFWNKSDGNEIHADSYQVISTRLGLAFCAAATYATNPTPCDRRPYYY